MTIDLSLDKDKRLYTGLAVEVMAGKGTLLTPPDEALPVILRNLSTIDIDKEEVVLTGSMAIWAYLAVFHYLHGKTKRIYYQDGMGNNILVAAHG
jgi:hypothetical protein